MRETAYYVQIVLALRFPGVTVGYYLSFLRFVINALPLLGFHSLALMLQGIVEFHKDLKAI